MPISITLPVLQWPTTAAQLLPHAQSIATKNATGLAKDVQGAIWQRGRFVRWTGRSFEAWRGEGGKDGSVTLWNNAQNKRGTPYTPLVHLTKTPSSKVLVIDVRALAVSKWQPLWAEALGKDLAGPKVKEVVFRG